MKCTNCGIDLKIKFKLKYNVYQCNKCKIQFAKDAKYNEELTFNLDEVNREKALRELRIYNFNIIASYIKNYFGDITYKGLEVSSGYGWFLGVCKENNIDCAGIEPQVSFENIYKKNGYSVLKGFFPEIINPDVKYNFIVFNDVFEHIPDFSRNISEISNHLFKNGLLVINIPVQNGFFYRTSVLLYYLDFKSFLNRMWQFNFCSPHIYYFTKKNLVSIILKEKFELIHIVPMIVIEPSQIKPRINQDSTIKKYKSNIFGFLILLISPISKLFPDIYCYFFRKSV